MHYTVDLTQRQVGWKSVWFEESDGGAPVCVTITLCTLFDAHQAVEQALHLILGHFTVNFQFVWLYLSCNFKILFSFIYLVYVTFVGNGFLIEQTQFCDKYRNTTSFSTSISPVMLMSSKHFICFWTEANLQWLGQQTDWSTQSTVLLETKREWDALVGVTLVWKQVWGSFLPLSSRPVLLSFLSFLCPAQSPLWQILSMSSPSFSCPCSPSLTPSHLHTPPVQTDCDGEI